MNFGMEGGARKSAIPWDFIISLEKGDATLFLYLRVKGGRTAEEAEQKGQRPLYSDELSYYQHEIGLKVLADEVVGKIDYGVELGHLLDGGTNAYLKM